LIAHPVTPPGRRQALPLAKAQRLLVCSWPRPADRGDLVRTVSLSDLAWSEDFSSDWPAAAFDTLPEGPYQVRMKLEVLGGKSWEFHCGVASYDVRHGG
jgi:hypothetical protein